MPCSFCCRHHNAEPTCSWGAVAAVECCSHSQAVGRMTADVTEPTRRMASTCACVSPRRSTMVGAASDAALPLPEPCAESFSDAVWGVAASARVLPPADGGGDGALEPDL